MSWPKTGLLALSVLMQLGTYLYCFYRRMMQACKKWHRVGMQRLDRWKEIDECERETGNCRDAGTRIYSR
ncbi:hypothetical protein AOQ84DRAFT_382243 [Glonium stellatum]|uniref:Uncharacterized protein n=1 Tax=Glonium stellatum TaxID=574774 RepID=A0A8E2EQ75_9PEZI|nr:hypothetical protein AOQ84DRAFT_382243 [Glonium stellatum]